MMTFIVPAERPVRLGAWGGDPLDTEYFYDGSWQSARKIIEENAEHFNGKTVENALASISFIQIEVRAKNFEEAFVIAEQEYSEVFNTSAQQAAKQ